MPAGKFDRLPRSARAGTAAGGFGMAVRTYRADYASIGQFGWDGAAGTSTYGDPDKQLIGIPLTQVGTTNPDSTRAILDFWTTLYPALED